MKKNSEKSCKEFFGERLKQLRNEKGLSQDALAKALGISKGSLGFYETCKNTPDIVVLNAVSDYFGVSLDYLLGRTDIQTNDTDVIAVCKYTGLSEIAVKTLNVNYSGVSNVRQENTDSFSFSDLRRGNAEAASTIIENGYFHEIVSAMAELKGKSENLLYNHQIGYDVLSEALDISPYLAYKITELVWNLDTIESIYRSKNQNTAEVSTDCDLNRYKLIKYAEEMSNFFDHRKDYLKFTHEELLKHLNLTEERLKELQEEIEQERKSGKHNKEAK